MYICNKKKSRMQKTITIDRQKLLERVRLTIAYIADRNPAMQERYSEAVMTTGDDQLAETYWQAALTWAATALKRFGGETLPDDTGVALVMLSPNSLASKTATIGNIVTSAVENKVLADWLGVIGDAAGEEKYRTRAQGYAEEAIDLCLRRVRPVRLSSR